MTRDECKQGAKVITPTGRTAIVRRVLTRPGYEDRAELRYVNGDVTDLVSLPVHLLRPFQPRSRL